MGEEMPAATTDERRRSFDQMAQLYSRARGAPPPALFDALAVFVPPPADALEIGCGPGGARALIWGSPRRTVEDNRVDEAIQAAYRVHAPEISRQTVDRMGGKVDEIGQAVRDTPELRDFE